MANTIIKGDELMVFVKDGNDYKSIAYATSHTLTLSSETTDINTKDHGEWGSTTVNKINWTASSENLFTREDYGMLFDIMIAKQPVKLYFGDYSDNPPTPVVDRTTGNMFWSATTSNNTGKISYTGDAIIESLEVNATSGENATLSVSFTGAGALTKVSPVA